MRYFTIFYYVYTYIYIYYILSQQRIFWVSISGAGQWWHENARAEKPEQPRKVPGTLLQPSWKELCWKFVGTVLEPSWNLPGSLLEPHCNHVGTAGIEGRSGRERQCIEFDFGGVGFAACVSALVTVPRCAFEPVVLLSPKTSFRVSLFYFCSVICLISMIIYSFA